MEDMREFLEDWALSVQRETLTRDREYRELERRRKELFTQLTQGDRALTVEDGLALLDLSDEMAEREKLFLLHFGLRLGIAATEE